MVLRIRHAIIHPKFESLARSPSKLGPGQPKHVNFGSVTSCVWYHMHPGRKVSVSDHALQVYSEQYGSMIRRAVMSAYRAFLTTSPLAAETWWIFTCYIYMTGTTTCIAAQTFCTAGSAHTLRTASMEALLCSTSYACNSAREA